MKSTEQRAPFVKISSVPVFVSAPLPRVSRGRQPTLQRSRSHRSVAPAARRAAGKKLVSKTQRPPPLVKTITVPDFKPTVSRPRLIRSSDFPMLEISRSLLSSPLVTPRQHVALSSSQKQQRTATPRRNSTGAAVKEERKQRSHLALAKANSAPAGASSSTISSLLLLALGEGTRLLRRGSALRTMTKTRRATYKSSAPQSRRRSMTKEQRAQRRMSTEEQRDPESTAWLKDCLKKLQREFDQEFFDVELGSLMIETLSLNVDALKDQLRKKESVVKRDLLLTRRIEELQGQVETYTFEMIIYHKFRAFCNTRMVGLGERILGDESHSNQHADTIQEGQVGIQYNKEDGSAGSLPMSHLLQAGNTSKGIHARSIA